MCRYCPGWTADTEGAIEHRAAADDAASDHRLAEAAILREATVASMMANKQSADGTGERAGARGMREWSAEPEKWMDEKKCAIVTCEKRDQGCQKTQEK